MTNGIKGTIEKNPKLTANNYAFIDAHNLYMSSQHWGWKLDYAKLRDLLQEYYSVTVAYLFMGYRSENNEVYIDLQKKGYILIFKDTVQKEEEIKGNCDVDLVLHAMIDYNNYNKAVIVTGDGDFASLIRYLYQNEKLETLLVPNQNSYSNFLKRTSKEKIGYLNLLRNKLSFDFSKSANSTTVRKEIPAKNEIKVEDHPAVLPENQIIETKAGVLLKPSTTSRALQKPKASPTTIHIE